MNKENLLKLAAYLDTLPLDYKHFEMSDFMQEGDPEKYTVYALENGGVATTCGAVACAVGHGPSAGFLFNCDELVRGMSYNAAGEFVKLLKPDWYSYTDRVFVSPNSEAFDFMFGGAWSAWDNTPCGAAARIRFAVEHGDEEFLYNLYCDRETSAYPDYVKPEAREFWEQHIEG